MSTAIFGRESLTCGCVYFLESTGEGTGDVRRVMVHTCEAHREDRELAENGLADFKRMLEAEDGE